MRVGWFVGVLVSVGVAAGGVHGSTPSQLTSVASPAWARDGTRLAFEGASAGGGRTDIYAIGVSGGGLLDVTGDDEQPDHEFPAWSPGGLRIASSTALGGPNTNHELYSISSAFGGQTVAVAASTAVGPISWSRDGRWISFDSRFSAELARSDGSAHRTLAVNAGSPIWAPDARRLAVAVVQRDASNTDVELLTPAGKLVRRLTRTRLSESPVRWSHDGDRLLFTSDRSAAWDLYVMDANGVGQKRLAPGQDGDFSPSGRRVVYAGTAGIWIVGVDGNGRRRITRDGTQPRWSPGGAWIAFVARRTDGTTGIDLVRPDGSDRRPLV